MKKVVLFVLVLALSMFCFCGCAKEEAEETVEVEEEVEEVAEEETEEVAEEETEEVAEEETVEAESEEVVPVTEGKLTMLTNAAFPPFEYISDNEYAGVDVDIAKEIAADLGLELEVIDMNFNGIIAGVQDGRGDFGAAGMTIKPERLEQVDFSITYVTSQQYVVVPVDTAITCVEDLADVNIGVQEGTTGDFYATDDIKGGDDDGTVIRYNNAVIAAQNLAQGRCDAVICDKLPAESIVAENEGVLKLLELDEPLTEEEYAICVKKGNTAMLNAINNTLQRLMDEGKIDEFIVNHMNADVSMSEE